MSGEISPIEEDEAELQNEVAINSGVPSEYPPRMTESFEEGSLEAYIEGSPEPHSKHHSRINSYTNLLDEVDVYSTSNSPVTRSPARSPTHSPPHSPVQPAARSPTQSPVHSPPHSPVQPAAHSPIHSPTHSEGRRSGSESELVGQPGVTPSNDLMNMMLVQHETPAYSKDTQELLVDAFPPGQQPPAKPSKWALLKKTILVEVEYYRKLSWFQKIVYWLESPMTLLRNMTIPVVMEERYDKFLLLLTAFGMPLFIFHKSEKALSELMFGLPSWLVLLAISLVLFVFFACCMPFEGAPKKSMFFVGVCRAADG